ncbi:FAD-dependent oxidoreductase [Streptomyces sp. M10(2022)]
MVCSAVRTRAVAAHAATRLPLRHSGGLTDSFARVPRTPPFSALGFVALSPTFGWRDLAAMDARAALPLLDVRVPEVYERFDDLSATAFLESVRFPEAAHHLAFEVFSRSFFADPCELSAAELLLMFHIYFLGSAEGLLFDVPTEPFPRHSGIRSATTSRASAHSCAPVPGTRDHSRDGGGADVRTEAGTDRHQAVVLALDTAGLRQTVAASPGLGTSTWRDSIAALRTAPPFLVSRLWLDRPVRADRPGFLGTSGYGGLDNISSLERYEGEAARWAARTGGSVIELHAYAADPAAERKDVQDGLVDRLHEVYPETREARIVDARHEWRADCPFFERVPTAGAPPCALPTRG